MFWKIVPRFGSRHLYRRIFSSAQQSAEFDACMAQADGVSSKMLECGKAEIGKWDVRLNAAYQTLLHGSADKMRAQLQQEEDLAQTSFE
ncbi:lysozyme inhibitor LprI family protein [Bradyrhizobium sp. CB82]|uniref:lysozyme inhibitor LprI family protein n=1 Tax=Bradyrhizobium sp. CB82 TaxID=3039159 RepID=UPI0024B04986|nr:lysozyme inhibitor LprI family protein [Bradyrhizobium sp. CB82]WFU44380.1 lysozyme inhibitor LprI family protein [Bradyrhizobium sp. CB82]